MRRRWLVYLIKDRGLPSVHSICTIQLTLIRCYFQRTNVPPALSAFLLSSLPRMKLNWGKKNEIELCVYIHEESSMCKDTFRKVHLEKKGIRKEHAEY